MTGEVNFTQFCKELCNHCKISYSQDMEEKIDVLETLRNKLLHGDYYIDKDNIILTHILKYYYSLTIKFNKILKNT